MSTNSLPRTESPLLGLGMSSLVLGVIGLLLFFLPVLGIPISSFGLLLGVVGLLAAFLPTRTSLRWSLAGTAASVLALSINLAIFYAPAGYLHDRKVPQLWRPDLDRPYLPPPAQLAPEEPEMPAAPPLS
jgi:hypothetical protein